MEEVILTTCLLKKRKKKNPFLQVGIGRLRGKKSDVGL